MKILPIASGKGGVGKSLIAANLAIALAETGKKVFLADLDLGGSNLHTLLGLRSIEKGLGTYLNSSKTNFEEIIIKTEYSGLLFIPGDAEIPGMANLTHPQKRSLLKSLTSLKGDFLILDLGAGTGYNVIDFFLLSGRGIIISTPGLTSILNSFLFIKSVIFRIIESSFSKNSKAIVYINNLKKEGKPLQKMYLPQILARIKEIDPDSYQTFYEKFANFQPSLIFNMIEDPKQAEKSLQLRRSAKEYLDMDIEHLGIIYRDDIQKIAQNSRLPIVKYKPNSVLSTAIYRIADKIMQYAEEETGVILDIQSFDESYQAAEIEAQIDYDSKIAHIEDLLHCEDFTKGDLIETIKNQQFELEKLKKENLVLKQKLVRAINEGFKD